MTLPALLAALLLLLAGPAAAQTGDAVHGTTDTTLTEPGQAAFGALSEVVARLDADPATEWSQVDLGALVAHLRDMDLVFGQAVVVSVDVADGASFDVTGPAEVAAAIQRMARAHGPTLSLNWTWELAPLADGMRVAVTAPLAGVQRLRAIGFLGLLADGAHHRAHHWAIALKRFAFNVTRIRLL